MVKPATANINPVLAILAINTPAPARATPAAPALLVVVSIPPVPAHPAMNGKTALVLLPAPFVILVLYIIAIIPAQPTESAAKLYSVWLFTPMELPEVAGL